MRSKYNKKLLSLFLLGATSHIYASENLGLISVESSTIDDKFMSNKTEASSVSSISGEKIDDSHLENIQQALQQIPGITSEVKSGDSLKIHIRGVENQMYMGEKPGVAVVIDGVPVFERTGSVNIDLDNIESIKVIKGGASYLFGDDALSGAVIITTKKGAKQAYNLATIERGSFGYQKLLAKTGYSNDSMNFHIQGSKRSSDGYWEDSQYSAKYFNGKYQYYIDDSSDITIGGEYSKREKDSHGTVGGVAEAKSNPKSIYNGDMQSRDYSRMYNVELLKLFATYSKDFENNSNLLLSTYIYSDETSFWSGPQTRNITGFKAIYGDKDYTNDNFYDQTQKGIKAEYRTSSERFATLLGLDLRNNEYKNKTVNRVSHMNRPFGTLFSAGDTRSQDKTDEEIYAIYGEYKHQINNKLSATLNLRYDTIKLDNTDILLNKNLKKDFDVYSYRVGSNYDISDNQSLFINYSTGFRAPTINQLFAGDTSAWGSTTNNQNLKPEKSHNYEIGTRGFFNTLFYEASIFKLDRKSFIMKTSGNYGDTDTNDMWDNIGGAKHEGFELSLSDQLINNLSYNIAYTFLRAKYTSYDKFGIHFDRNGNDRIDAGEVEYYNVTGNYIPRTPKHSLNLLLEYKLTPQFTLSPEFNYKSNYYADDLNSIKLPSVTTVNLLANYRTKLNRFDTTFFCRVDNLFNKFYYNTARASGDRDNNLVFNEEDLSLTVNEGRKYTAGLAIKF